MQIDNIHLDVARLGEFQFKSRRSRFVHFSCDNSVEGITLNIYIVPCLDYHNDMIDSRLLAVLLLMHMELFAEMNIRVMHTERAIKVIQLLWSFWLCWCIRDCVFAWECVCMYVCMFVCVRTLFKHGDKVTNVGHSHCVLLLCLRVSIKAPASSPSLTTMVYPLDRYMRRPTNTSTLWAPLCMCCMIYDTKGERNFFFTNWQRVNRRCAVCMFVCY